MFVRGGIPLRRIQLSSNRPTLAKMGLLQIQIEAFLTSLLKRMNGQDV